MAIFKRFPKWSQLIPVYAVESLVIYTWTIMWFFWKLPSWLYFLNASEVGISLAYILATNFVESILVLCVPVFLGFILPRRWFLDVFVARAACLVLLGLGYMIYLAQLVQAKVDHPTFSYRLEPIAFAGGLILVSTFVVTSIKPVCKVIEWFSKQATILLYLITPVSIISVLVVAFRLI